MKTKEQINTKRATFFIWLPFAIMAWTIGLIAGAVYDAFIIGWEAGE